MPVYKVTPKDPHKTPGGVRMVTGDTASQIAKYLSRQYEISSMSTDDMVPLIRLGVEVEDARPTQGEDDDNPRRVLATGSFIHKAACMASSNVPIGGPNCICFSLDSEPGWKAHGDS